MKKQIFYFLLILTVFISPFYVNAQGENTEITVRITNPFNCGTGDCTLIDLITAILNNIIMPIAVVGVIMWIIWAGFGFLTAQGNSGKLDIAKSNLLWSLIGAGILLGAAGISLVVQNTVRALMAP